MKIALKLHLHYDTDPCLESLGWSPWYLARSKYADESSGYIYIGERAVEIEVPDHFDPRPAQVEALEAKKRALQAQFAAAVKEINRQIIQLLAIEHEVSA